MNNIFNQNSNPSNLPIINNILFNNEMQRINESLYNSYHIAFAPKFNINFISSEGLIFSITTPIYTTIEQLLKIFMGRKRINENYINRIIFSINNHKLDPKSQEKVGNILFNNCQIYVTNI